MNEQGKPILVIGGGIAGMTAAVEAAEVGHQVILVEKEASLGGRVMRSYRYFPKMCPPSCGFEINTRRIRQNPRITVHTLASVEEISGSPGHFRVRIRMRPRYVTGTHSLDASASEPLTSERDNDANLGMDKTKALYLPHDIAYPPTYVLDREALSVEDAASLIERCPDGAIDMSMDEQSIEVDASAVIVATGWRPYDATKLDNLGFGQFANVVTNVMMERLASSSGPTGGVIRRPSDGQPPEHVAFVQCAGSRDTNHLPYCSSVCCMGSLKQVRYLREQHENAKATVFYIDIRTIGRLERFYRDMLDDESVSFVKGKVARISESTDGKLVLDVEDTMTRDGLHPEFDMVVLATGIVPNTDELKIPLNLSCDEYGFVHVDNDRDGIYAAGCAKHPCDVSRSTRDSTSAALKAIQCLRRES